MAVRVEPFGNSEQSLSARRAWIEILTIKQVSANTCIVALRKESVDRNAENPMISVDKISSLSARRAWIEIVALVTLIPGAGGRSPQGERG